VILPAKKFDSSQSIGSTSTIMAVMDRSGSKAINDGQRSASARAREDDDPVTSGPGFELPPELMEKVIVLFLKDAPRQIDELQVAQGNGNIAVLGSVSHKIRGSSDILGTKSISVLALAVEEAAKNQDMQRATDLTLKLIEELQALMIQLTCVDAE
jgi:HPt (histidine-containing phosphotransfer) domain-containing protein